MLSILVKKSSMFVFQCNKLNSINWASKAHENARLLIIFLNELIIYRDQFDKLIEANILLNS